MTCFTQEAVETEAGAPCASDPEHDYDAATDGSSLSGQEEHMSHTQEMEVMSCHRVCVDCFILQRCCEILFGLCWADC